MWAENHFSTWMNKDGPAEKAREHDRFVELGIAPFPDLLLASATSPAMLIYLDQRYSVANRLNENYAREIMELAHARREGRLYAKGRHHAGGSVDRLDAGR